MVPAMRDVFSNGNFGDARSGRVVFFLCFWRSVLATCSSVEFGGLIGRPFERNVWI